MMVLTRPAADRRHAAPYFLQTWDLKGKSAFPAFGFTVLLLNWAWWRLPEAKGCVHVWCRGDEAMTHARHALQTILPRARYPLRSQAAGPSL